MPAPSARWGRALAALGLVTACGCGGGPDAHDLEELGSELPVYTYMRCGSPMPPADQDIGPIDVFNEQGDAALPPKVTSLLASLRWPEEHFNWHTVRRFDQACPKVDWSKVTDRDAPQCDKAQEIVDSGLWRAPIQEGAPGDGYAFLVMHRHMLEGMREAYPDHPELFTGFTHVPRTTSDPENPIPGRTVFWSEAQLRAIDALEHIEEHLGEFPTEDALGLYIQVPYRWTAEAPQAFVEDESNGIHVALHAQWAISGSPLMLSDTRIDVNNRVFWKLHGWIDDIWQRYRKAKGISDDDPDYQDALLRHCEEMHAIGTALDEAKARAGGARAAH